MCDPLPPLPSSSGLSVSHTHHAHSHCLTHLVYNMYMKTRRRARTIHHRSTRRGSIGRWARTPRRRLRGNRNVDCTLSLCVVVVGGYCSLRVEGSDVCGSLALEQTLSLMGLRYFPQPCGDFGRREGKAQLVLDVHADGGGDDVGVVGVDRRKEKLCTSVCLRIDLVESPLALQRIEHHPRDLRFAR